MAQRTLVVGLGSTGMRIAQGVLDRIEADWGSLDRVPWVRAVAFETEVQSESPMARRGMIRQIGISEEEYAPMVTDPAGLQESNGFQDWHDPATIGMSNAGTVGGSGNIRMVGRATFLHPSSFTAFHEAIESALNALAPSLMTNQVATESRGTLDDGTKPEVLLGDSINVFVCGSLTGGTCSGSFIDVGYYISTMPGQKTQVFGLFGIPSDAYGEDVHKANAYTALKELNHYHQDGVRYRTKFPTRNTTTELIGRRPYHSVFLCQPRTGVAGGESTINASFAEFVYLSAVSSVGDRVWADLINPGRVYANQRDRRGCVMSFNSLGVSILQFPADRLIRACGNRLAYEAIDEWMDNLPPDSGPAKQLMWETLGLEPNSVTAEIMRPQGNMEPFTTTIESVVSEGVSGARGGDFPSLADCESRIEAGFRHDVRASHPITPGLFLDAISENGQALVASRLERFEAFVRTSLHDGDRGPAWIRGFLGQLRQYCIDWRNTLTSAEGGSMATQDVSNYRAAMDRASTRIEDGMKSFLVKIGLIYKPTAVHMCCDEYQSSANPYWEARLKQACEPSIIRLCNELIERSDRYHERLVHELYGVEKWAELLSATYKKQHDDLDGTVPVVNGEVLFQAKNSVDVEYQRVLGRLTHSGEVEISPIYAKGPDYARRKLLTEWRWIADQVVAPQFESAFDPPQVTDRLGKRKPVEAKESETLLQLARAYFVSLRAVSVLDRVSESDLPRVVTDVRAKATYFLDVNDVPSPRGKPSGKADLRLPRFAFYRNAEAPAPGSKEEQVKNLLAQETKHFVNVDESHRIVFIEARATFGLSSINGLDPSRNNDFLAAYNSESQNRRLESRIGRDARWAPLDGKPEVPDAPHILAQFLAGIALGTIRGSAATPFLFDYTARAQGGKSGRLELPHELTEVVWEFGHNLDAKFSLKQKLDETRSDIDENAIKLNDFINNINVYDLKYGGQPVDTQFAERLLRVYVQGVDGLSQAWQAMYPGGPSIDDYLYDDNSNPDPNVKRIDNDRHPIPGYYCPLCGTFLADKFQKDQVKPNCPVCNVPLV